MTAGAGAPRGSPFPSFADGPGRLGLVARGAGYPGRDLEAATRRPLASRADDPTLADVIRGLTPVTVAEGLAAVDAARTAEDAQTRATEDAQRATVLRDEAARAPRVRAGELAEVAEVALPDRPQLRETLGLLER